MIQFRREKPGCQKSPVKYLTGRLFSEKTDPSCLNDLVVNQKNFELLVFFFRLAKHSSRCEMRIMAILNYLFMPNAVFMFVKEMISLN